MSYQIALNFEDGVTRFIEAAGHETVADAAYRQGINIPLDCRDGACGTCKCKAESGRYDLGDNFIEDALSEDEISEGYVLTCQMRAESDCVIRIPASSQLCKTEQASFEAAISDVRQLSASTIALSIKGESSAAWPSCRGNMSTSRCRAASRAEPIRSARCRRTARSAS